MPLEAFDIVNGIVLIIFCVISIYVGLRIISKYFEYKTREFILVGITWICMVSPWYPATISFVMYIFTETILSPEAYFIISFVFVPIAVVCWMIAFTDITDNKKQKLIVSIYFLLSIVYYVLFFFFLYYTDQSLIGKLRGYTDVEYGALVVSFYLIANSTALITGIIFARKSRHAENPEIRLKGNFILMAVIFYFIGSTLDAILPHNFLTFSIFRTLEILSAIFFYCGFILPNWIKKSLLKGDKVENTSHRLKGN